MFGRLRVYFVIISLIVSICFSLFNFISLGFNILINSKLIKLRGTFSATTLQIPTKLGMDGWIKMWHYGRFKLDPLSDDITVVIKPVFEIKVQDDRGHAIVSYILKKNEDPKDSVWFAQDRNGGLWEVDVEVSATMSPPVRLYSCHAGPVTSVAISPWSPILASLAANGVLHLYNLATGKLMAVKQFSVGGSRLYWLFLQVSADEEIIAAGFMDGSLKLLSLKEDGAFISIKQLQDSKPHKERISAISVNKMKTLLVSGSDDGTVFVYNLQTTGQLTPVGYLRLQAPVRWLSWNPTQASVLLICCTTSLSEALIPEEGFTGISYQLNAPVTTVFPVQSAGATIEDLIYAIYSQENSIYMANSNALYEYNWETNRILNETVSNEKFSAVYILHDGSLWFTGLENGKLRIFTKQPNEWLSSKDYDDISLHDIAYGSITDINVSFNLKYLVDCGMDGNVFVYSLDTKSETVQELPIKKTSLHVLSEDMEVSEEEAAVSLEEAKKDAVLREKMAVSMMKKVRVQKQLANLRLRYCEILNRNSELPDSQRLRYSEFLLDKRLQFHIQDIKDKEMKLVKQKLSFEVQKSQLHLNKLKSNFIDCLAAFHVEISAIRGKRSVSTFVHRKLDKEFEEGEALVNKLLQKTHEKIRDSGTELIPKPTAELSPSYIIEVEKEEPYQRSVQDIYDKLNIKTKRALEKHKYVKKKKEDRKKEWQNFMATRPDQDKNLSTDVTAIEHAMRTIGDYKLKSSHDFKLPDQSKNTSLHKLNQLVQAKREIFNMKESFNSKVYALRRQKVELLRNMHQLENQLLYLHEELDEHSRIPPLPMPQLNIAKEFPERQYQIHPEREPEVMTSEPPEYDEEFSILYGQQDSAFMSDGENRANMEEDTNDTEWEGQIRTLRTTRQLFKQNQILEEMERLLTEFDRHVEELRGERVRLSIDIKYLECFVNLLHQEFHIMHSFDDGESAILERVNNSLAEKHTKHLRINILQHKIDIRAAELALLEEQLAAVEKSFTELSSGSRAVKHLTRIFRKKSRPHLFASDEEEERESEEESSSEETSEDSDTAVRVGKPSPRTSDKKCPIDCEVEMHKETLQLRAKRYKLEAKINTEKSAIEQMRREKERNFKFLKLIEPVLRMNQDQLEKTQKDKQMKLNETEVLVVLNCSQICGQNLLMSREELDKLRARVFELQRQTDMQQEKLRKSQRYQQRLSEECLYMESKISQLKKDIDKAMICKFGQHVDVEVLEEKILEQMIQNTRKSLREEELHKKYEKIMKDLKEERLEKTEDLADLMRENTHKLQMLSSLEEEKQKLISLAQRVKKAAADSNDREVEYTEDVRNLTKILHNLILQKETIIHEIKVLTLKGRPLPPIPPSIVEEQTKSTTAMSQSRDSDDLASTECQTTREGSPGYQGGEEVEETQEPRENQNDQQSDGSDSNENDLMEQR